MTLEELKAELEWYESVADNDPVQASYMLKKLRVRELLDVAEAADKAAHEIDLYYRNMTQENRVQTIHEDDHSLWFCRDDIWKNMKDLLEEK